MATQELHVRLAEIEVMRSTMDEKIIGIFRFDNESKLKKPSTLLILAEIGSTLYLYERLLDTLNATAEQVRHLASGMDGDPMARFEKIIQRLNDSVARFIEQEGTPLAWGRVNIFVLQIADGHLCFSGIGSLMNVFLQRQPGGNHRAFDLLGSLEQPAEVDPKKPFAALVCGDLQAGDLFFLGTLNFQRLREQLHIVDRLKELPPVTAAVEIKQALEETDIPDDFAAVIIAGVTLNSPDVIAPARATPKKEAPPKPKSAESIEQLYAAEQETEALIDATAPRHTTEEAEGSDDLLLEPVSREPSVSLKDRVFQWADTLKNATKRSKERPDRQPIVLASLRGMHDGYAASLNSEKKQKIWMAVASVIVLIGGGFWYHAHQQAKAEQLLWNSVFDQATDNKNRAEADLVYGNEERARRLVTEAVGLVRPLDTKTTDRTTAKEKLQKELAALQMKFRKEQRVDAPTSLFQLQNAPADSLNGLIIEKNSAYTLDKSKNQVVALDLTTQAQTPITVPADTTLRLIGNGKDAPLLLSQEETLYTVKEGKLVSLAFNAIKATSTQAITSYGQRLYTLDPVGNMIWRYTGSGSGYGGETTYLKRTGSDLQDATSLAIDSSIYVGHRSGRVDKFLSGAQDPSWSLSPIDPPLTNVSSLWTSADASILAIADQVGKRVLLFGKEGKLVSQIVSATFTGPTAVWGDSANKKLYVIDHNQLLRFDLP